MDYRQKYQKYKNKYFDLKNRQNIYNLLGGVCEPDKKFSYDDMSSVLDYAKNRYECTENKKTDKKYFVILYGPPASGKTISRKVACAYIKKHFSESLPIEDIYKSFIDTQIDDIVYDAYYKEEMPLSVKNKLKKTIDTFFEQQNIQSDKRLDFLKSKTIDTLESKPNDTLEFIEKNNEIYKKYRFDKNIDDLSALLGTIATYTNHNVFFETASGRIDYINNLIKTIYYKNYNIVFIYPYTDNIDLLVDRNYSRALNEGRILTQDYIKFKKEECYTAYQSNVIADNEKSMINKHKTIMILRYDTNLEKDLYDNLNSFIINDDFEKKILDFQIRKNQEIR